MSKERLIYLPLGGAGEIGMNTYVYGYGAPGQERLIVVDLGVTFPDMDGSPGVDLIYADVDWLVERADRIDGVFITHIHIDHILGLNDLPGNTPVYIGPGDASATALLNLASAGTTDRLLETQGLLREWNYQDGKILDVFGDASVFAIHSPGHTPGATAFLVNSTDGPQLMLGDVTHTQWGWDNGVEPGTYSADIPTSAASLLWLKELVDERPNIRVHPGHQDQ